MTKQNNCEKNDLTLGNSLPISTAIIPELIGFLLKAIDDYFTADTTEQVF